MKMLPNSQATFFDGMELPLMSSRAASHAKTLAAQESKPESVKAHEAVSGPKSSDLLASYHPATSSWRTSQTCLVALLNNEGDGLAKYSETWPSAGMMQNGKTYRRHPWALPIAESAFGLWPTPLKSSMQANFSAATVRKVLDNGKQEHLCYRPILLGWDREMTASIYAMAMGFPNSWASLTDTEMP